jgi:hypothetical protein
VVNTLGEFWCGTGNSVAGIELSCVDLATVDRAIAIDKETVEGDTDRVGCSTRLVKLSNSKMTFTDRI